MIRKFQSCEKVESNGGKDDCLVYWIPDDLLKLGEYS